jgi:diguanylate cyclase (GGDEF)-like protein/hemerythrin-like metal-binding protein
MRNVNTDLTSSPLAADRQYALLDRLPIQIMVCEADTLAVRFVNRAFSEVLDVPAGIASKLDLWWSAVQVETNLPDSANTEWVCRAMRAAAPGGGVEARDADLRCRDGSVRRMRVCISEQDGSRVITFIDLSEARKAQLRLEEQSDQLSTMLSELERISSTDRLTGLWNRRRLEEGVASEMHRFKRFRFPVSMIIADIDHFKRINDTYGHPVGDGVLRQFARRVQDICRESDQAARFGGEEFVVLCPGTPLRGAAELAGRLRSAIADETFPEVGAVTASFGVAECQADESWEGWLRRADAALYRAKQAGRNRVDTAPATSYADFAADALPRGVMHLDWGPEHSVGHPLIDRQHQRLYEVANELLNLIHTNRPAPEIRDAIGRFKKLASIHFRTEEGILRQIGYEGLTEHAATHARLERTADSLESAWQGENLPVERLIDFIAFDLVDHHALGADRDYVPCLMDAIAAGRPLTG